MKFLLSFPIKALPQLPAVDPNRIKVTVLTPVLFCVAMLGCKVKDSPNPTPTTPTTTTSYSTGWLGTENLSTVPVSTNFGLSATNSLPTSVDLSAYLPPVAQQGNYGTCVSWSTGYYTKTAVEGLARGYTTTQLNSPSYQISPRDLFTAVPDAQKNKDCNGSSFTGNLDVLQQRGAATLSTVPYSNLGDCSRASLNQAWATEAAKHKIKSYRTIDPSVNSIKQQLANKVPVMLGAFLADNFMTWNSDNVLSSNTTYTNVGKHAGHALTIVGYDDRKGANGAFKVVNSWGTGWGSKGFIWIDYNFLVNTFAQDTGGGNKNLMVMVDNTTKPQDNPTPTPTTPTGIDLVAWVFSDLSTYQRTGNAQSRIVQFNIYNIGRTTAPTTTPWKIYYAYYNAYNANDYGILFQQTFTARNLAPNTYQCDNYGNCNTNIPIPAGSSLSRQLFGNDNGVTINYSMRPTLNGSYYLALLVDFENVLNDANPSDNYFYTTENPIVFRNGYAARLSTEAQLPEFSFKNPLMFGDKAARRFNTAVSTTTPNAYSPEEIVDFLRQQRRNGGFDQKLKDYARQYPASSMQMVNR